MFSMFSRGKALLTVTSRTNTCRLLLLIFSVNLILYIASCKKLVEVDPPITRTTGASVFSSNASAIAVLNGLYSKLSVSAYPATEVSSVSLWTALSADELTLWNGVTSVDAISCYTNSFSSSVSSGVGPNFWSPIYNNIYTCNSVIEGVGASTTLNPNVKNQLLGEAKFMRAFLYFYLINLYGDAPLVVTTDYKINSSLHRSPIAKVYEQIISDLKDAQSILSEKYLDVTLLNETNERTRPTKWSATALLARVYLYTGNWSDAETMATEIINHSSIYSLENLSNAFLANNSEAIWQLQPVTYPITNTQDAKLFIIPPSGFSEETPAYISTYLLNSFEYGDQRKVNWLGKYTDTDLNLDYYYPFKYKINQPNEPVSEYLMILRFSEQYLIRAEARAEQGKGADAITDLNLIRNRAGLDDYKGALDLDRVKAAIMHERQVELFTEFGHRWLDLKRTGMADAVMSIVTPEKGGSWSPNWQLYPIPSGDIQRDPNLVQNKGY